MKNTLRFLALILCMLMILPNSIFAKSTELPEGLLEEMRENIGWDLDHLGCDYPEELELRSYYGEIGGYHFGVFRVGGMHSQVITHIVIRNYEFSFSDSGAPKGFFAYKDGEFEFYEPSMPSCRFTRIIEDLSEEDFIKLANAAGAVYKFSDVNYRLSWYGSAIDFCVYNGDMTGIGDNKFDPEGLLTREQFVTILARIADADLTQYTESDFTDVNVDSWYGPSVVWAAENGYVKGIGNGKFGVGQNIDRESLATLFYRYADKQGIDTAKLKDISVFDDHTLVSDWAEDGVKFCAEIGVIKGTDKNTINPKGVASRAEIAQIFKNYLYYTSLLCKIEFDANGGECEESVRCITAGDTVGTLPLPVREGYKFDGWWFNEGGERAKFDTVFDTDTILTAKWAVGNKVVFILDGGSCDIEYKYVISGESLGELPVPVREGYSFLGWYYNDALVDENTVIESDVDFFITAAWAKIIGE